MCCQLYIVGVQTMKLPKLASRLTLYTSCARGTYTPAFGARKGTETWFRITWGPQAIMFINIIEIRRNDRLSAAQYTVRIASGYGWDYGGKW